MREHGSRLILRTNQFEPTIIQRAEGCWLQTTDSDRYLDMESGIWCCSLGHNHPMVSAAAVAQMGRIVHLGPAFLAQATIEAAEALSRLTGGRLNRVVFLSSGSEAMEMAINLVRQATGRQMLIGFDQGYLGAFGSAAEASGPTSTAKCMKVPTPDCLRCPVGATPTTCGEPCIDPARHLINQSAHEVAALVIEPILASAGVIIPPAGYMRKLGALAEEAGVLLVVDEVTTGLGRTGRWFAHQHYYLQPDVIVLSKALGNGFPIAAVLCSADLEAQVVEKGFRYTQSHQSDPFGCAIANEVLRVIAGEGLIEISEKVGEQFKKAISTLSADFPQVREVRGRGLMIGLEFADHDGRAAEDLARKAQVKLRERRVVVGLSRLHPVLRLLPPLIIGEGERILFLQALELALRDLRS